MRRQAVCAKSHVVIRVLQWVVVGCSGLLCISTGLQCVAVCCIGLQWGTVGRSWLQEVAVGSSELQGGAVVCSGMQ